MENQNINFENMGIYDLRNYARSIGVISPTKLKRDELIEKITAIIHGAEPEAKKTNKGRPPKHKIGEQISLDFILPDGLFKTPEDPRYKKYEPAGLKFGYGDILREGTSPAQTNILYEGYYKPYNANFGFVLQKGFLSDYYKENVVILNSLVDEYQLREGDFVSGASSYISNKNVMLATSILSINGQAKQHEQRFDFSNARSIKPCEKIKLDTDKLIDYKIIDQICPIIKGTRVLINFKNQDSTKNTLIGLLNGLASNNIMPFLITIDDLLEEIYDIADCCDSVEFITHQFNMDRQNYIDSLDLRLKHCLRLVENGINVAVVVYNTNNLASNISTSQMIKNNLSQDVAMAFAQNKLKDLFCMSRAFERGSLTTIFVNSDCNALADICKTNIIFNSEPYYQTDVTVDMTASYTRNIQEIITPAEYNLLKEFKSNVSSTSALEALNNLFK